jgi:hypothetical protein
MVEGLFVGSVTPSNARWSGLHFETGTASPLVYFSAGAFQTSGVKPALWVTDHFDASP